MVSKESTREEPLNKLLNSHPAGFYFYLNGVAEIRVRYGFLPDLLGREFICTVCYVLSIFAFSFSRVMYVTPLTLLPFIPPPVVGKTIADVQG